MATQTIQYQNKVALNTNPDIADINKVTDNDMNEIKSVVNNNANETSTNSTNITNIINAEVYSTNEIKTNKTWIDGKPIYRKVISDITVTGNMSEIISTGLSNVNVISIYGEYHTANYDITQTVPYISSNREYVIEVISMNKGANIRYRTASVFNGKSNIVLEYTKTTD